MMPSRNRLIAPWLLTLVWVGWIIAADEKAVETTATQLSQSFKENEVAAEDKYKGKTLEVTGKVQRVYETTKPNSACIELEDETRFSTWRVKCQFDPKSADHLTSVQKGQTIKLSGTCDGKERLWVRMSSCKLIDPAPEKVPAKDTKKVEGGTKDKPLVVKATEVAKSYQANEIAADRMFKDKVVQITGQVKRVHKKRAISCVDLVTGLGLSLLSIECQFDAKSSDDLGKLTKGQEVTIVGTVNGKGLFSTVEIKECVLIK